MNLHPSPCALCPSSVCPITGAVASKFKAYPFGEDKEDDSKAYETAAEAFQDAADSVPDKVRRGDVTPLDQEVSTAFGTSPAQAGERVLVVVAAREWGLGAKRSRREGEISHPTHPDTHNPHRRHARAYFEF